MGISRPTAHKWIRRRRLEGDSGLLDRSSRPRRTPHRTAAATEAHGCRLRQQHKLGPARIGPILDLPASTLHRVLPFVVVGDVEQEARGVVGGGAQHVDQPLAVGERLCQSRVSWRSSLPRTVDGSVPGPQPSA